MAGKSAVLTVKILSDASQAGKGIDQASGKFAKFESGVQKATRVAAGIGVALVAVGTKAVKSASDLEQAQGAVESIYGKSAAAVDKYAQTSVDRLGLSEAAYKNYSALVGAALQNAGFSAQKAAGMSDKAMVRAADMASTFGGTTSEAIDAINAAVSRAEFDPLEKYGVSLNKTAVNAELAKRGQDDLTGAALKQATAQATLDLIYKNTANAAGQFARESDTVAGQQQRAAAAFENASAALGKALLPAVAAVTMKLAEMAGWIGQNTTLVYTIAGVLGGFVATVFALNAALKAYQTITAAAQLVTTLWNSSLLILRVRLLAMAAAEKIVAAATTVWTAVTEAAGIAAKSTWRSVLGPIGLVVAAIGLVIGIVVLLWNKFPPFRNAVLATWRAIANAAKATWQGIKAVVAAVLGWAKGALRGLGAAAAAVWRGIRSAGAASWRGVRAVISTVLGWAKGALRGLGAATRAIWRGIQAAAAASWRGVRAVISTVLGWAKGALRGLGSAASAVWRGISSAASAAWRGIRSVVSTTVSAIRSLLSGVRSTASSAWSAVRSAATSAFRAILSPINAVKSAIDRVISAVKSAISWIGRIKIPDIGGLVSKVNPFSAVAPTPAPSIAAYAGPRSAPSLASIVGRRTYGATSSSGGGGIVINVSGTLNDVDTANAVRRVLRNDQRRRNGIVIDRGRQGVVN